MGTAVVVAWKVLGAERYPSMMFPANSLWGFSPCWKGMALAVPRKRARFRILPGL
jgi:hypothetical protein